MPKRSGALGAGQNAGNADRNARLSIGRIAHAGIVVQTGTTQVIMDPGLLPIMSRMYRLDPPIRVDRRKLRAERFDALVISHHHGDHFCLDSLSLLDRGIPVIYPKDYPLIESLLRRLGFREFRGVSAWETILIGDLELTPTPSQAHFPELGMVFAAGGRTCWNVVDTEINDATIRRVRRRFGQIDLLLCYYQLLIEWDVTRNALGGDFHFAGHEKQLSDVAKINPRCFVPGSCGWVDLFEPWRNLRQFQMTEPQFIADMKVLRPEIRAVRLGSGERIDLHRDLGVARRGLPFVQPRGSRKYSFYEWRPDRGIPPLVDPNPNGHRAADLDRKVRDYLNGHFLKILNDRHPPACVPGWRRRKLVWQLELVFPDGRREARILDFSGRRLRWRAATPEAFPMMHTSVAASVIPDLLSGRTHPVQAMRLTRRFTRQYVVTKQGLKKTEPAPTDVEPDPLSEVLFFGAFERALLRRVVELGY